MEGRFMKCCAAHCHIWQTVRFDSDKQTYLIGLAKAIDPPHLALLVGVGQHTHGRLLARDAEYEVFPALLCYVLPQLAQQPRRPLLLHLNFLVLKQRFHLLSSLPSTTCPDSVIRDRSTHKFVVFKSLLKTYRGETLCGSSTSNLSSLRLCGPLVILTAERHTRECDWLRPIKYTVFRLVYIARILTKIIQVWSWILLSYYVV